MKLGLGYLSFRFIEQPGLAFFSGRRRVTKPAGGGSLNN
jgi:hypothetical protein